MKIFDSDNWQEITYTLASNKRRTIATSFGVFWGIFMLVILVSISSGFRNGIQKMSEGSNPNTAIVATNKTGLPYKGYKSGRSWSITSTDLKIIRQHIPNIKYLGLQEWVWRPTITYKGKEAEKGSLRGVSPDVFYIIPPVLKEGRFFQAMDEERKRKVCVIGNVLEKTLFGNEPGLGKTICVNGIYVKIIGIVKNNDFGNFSDYKNAVLIPYSLLKAHQGREGEIDNFAFVPNGDIKKAIEQIKSILRERHHISPNDDRAFNIENLADLFELTSMLLLGMDILIWIIGIGTLLTGVIGVSNILLVTVRERTREIGVRRALGAKPRDIIFQLLSESFILTLSAGMLGMVIGVGFMGLIGMATENIQNTPFYNPTIPLSVAFLSLFIVMISGLLGGFLPAYRAIQIKAIDAIRDE